MFLLNVMWNSENDGSRFDILMAGVVFLTWLKLIFYFRVSMTFGPVFKILEEMAIDLARFMVIWLLLMIMFTCVAVLTFGQLETFQDLKNVFVYFFEASMGSWSMKVFDGVNSQGNKIPVLKTIGQVYMVIFILINMVMMLNFVIAVLSSTFAYYEEYKEGLYSNVIN